MSADREALRRWIAARRDELEPAAVGDRTPLVEGRLLRSIDLPELLLLLEELGGRPLDPSAIRPGSFADLDTICAVFLGEAGP